MTAYKDEEFERAAHTWRLLSFEAPDGNDHVVKRGAPDASMMLLIVEHSMGDDVARVVCDR